MLAPQGPQIQNDKFNLSYYEKYNSDEITFFITGMREEC